MFKSDYAQLARPAILPDSSNRQGLPAFASVGDMLRSYEGDDAIFVLYPKKIAAAARTFLNGFPGKVLYAVKANPHPAVLKTLWTAGVRCFDVASTREVELVKTIAPSATLYFMHPVKSRAAIRHAYANGVRDFSFDCADELYKLLEETGYADDLNLHVRLALPKGEAAMPLSGKFGASREEAVDLLQAARPHVAMLGLTFHVGSQCMNMDDYGKALAWARAIVDEAGIAIDSIDCGGGFPVAYPGMPHKPISDYFAAIRKGLGEHGFDGVQVLGEPGRALCAEGGSTLARVELRKGGDLYLNDGSYGSLFDAAQCAWKYPVKLHRAAPREAGTAEPFRFFGPTCDSLDVMEGPFELPDDVCEGDWVEVCHLGAYGQALASKFNGFHTEITVAVMA
ncbi:type III PLP-dependent enzyme [Henriciella aquimarina]|uniref:type III PLP-dependent enzyme n=1 Tax=Henriciella aquimarina TaxID=545261 RepID=UPI0009FC8A9A|nr:type III PLP-dependent enzyme [Henriciella aquimarina]